jgi:cyanophycin synthetase
MKPVLSTQASPVFILELSGKPYAFQGYVYGFNQPTLRYKLHHEVVNPSNLPEIDAFFSKELGVICDFDLLDENDPILMRLMQWPSALLNQASHPVFEPARILTSQGKDSDHHLILQPCMDHGAALSAVVFVIRLLKLAFQESAVDGLKEIKKSFRSFQENLSLTGLQGFNQKLFLLAASELGIQWSRLQGNIFLLGVGRNSRWLESSFTDATPVISSTIARHKPSAAFILNISGLPVVQPFLVKSTEEAVSQAEKLGYPVVIKPADLDGGQGVKTNLRTAESVSHAFRAASKLSKQVLVEKHVSGRDYRIHVVNGEVHGVLEREPGGVIGNGEDSVRTLLERQNHEREYAEDDRRYLHTMAFDEEAKELLADQHFDWNSVPAHGRFVRLRGACNVASGGVPRPVSLDQVHPDNLSLAIRAARVMRLDVAGVDLLIPDIEHSWLEIGASICEVNAQPQMFSTLHKPMLVSMFKGGNGRIPVAIIVEAECMMENISFSIQRECLARGINAGLVSGKEVWIGEQCVSKTSSGAFDGARILCKDTTVEAMVLHVTDNQVMRKGWPVDWCDVLLVGSGSPELRNPAYSPIEWLSFSGMLCPKQVIMDDAGPDVYSHASAMCKSKNMLSVPGWSDKEQRTITVMKVVNDLMTSL